MLGLQKLLRISLVLGGICLARPCIVRAQSNAFSQASNTYLSVAKVPELCAESTPGPALTDTFRLVCLREWERTRTSTVQNAIVIGFVGGFVRADDKKHPEVQFASFLGESYPSAHAEVFANHDGKRALRRVLQLLDTDGDGALTAAEKEKASIIIYGHSWGASQAITLARELERLNVPVLLTVQVDSVHKPGHHDSLIPSNVRTAINFYQTRGLIHGRSRIRAADPEKTSIIGNFQMAYKDRRINCDNYAWLARHLNKPHHEIENDPRVWDQIASLIDSTLSNRTAAVEASLPSPVFPAR